MRLLLLGPLPEPTTGHSLAFKVLRDQLAARHEVKTVNLSEPRMVRSSLPLTTAIRTLRRAVAIHRAGRSSDVIYLTIAESLLGNLKDLLFYAVCFRRLRRFVIHLHGGSIRHDVFERYPLLAALNRFFLRRLGGAIVLSDTHRAIFESYIAPERTWTVANYSDPEIVTDQASIDAKFAGSPITILYLSNFIAQKGYLDLLDAYQRLDEATRNDIRLEFAGAFDTDADRRDFVERIAGDPRIRFHGKVTGEAKRALLTASHVLCLPTRFREGQPLVILEAYAAGCAVVATPMGGIPDILTDGINGFFFPPGDIERLGATLAALPSQRDMLHEMALNNHRTATRRYTVAAYAEGVESVMDKVHRDAAGFG